MSVKCLFCDKDVTNNYKSFGRDYQPNPNTYICDRCGIVRLTEEAASDFPQSDFSEKDRNVISITLRNEWEQGGRYPRLKIAQRTLNDLRQMVDQFRPLEPL